MAKEIRNTLVPSDQMWALVELAKQKSGFTDFDLARAAKVSDRTVRNDRKNPSGMTVERFLAYLSYIMTVEDIYESICEILSEKLSQQRES